MRSHVGVSRSALFALALLVPTIAFAQTPVLEFRMGRFAIKAPVSALRVDGRRLSAQEWQQMRARGRLDQVQLSGRGTTRLAQQQVNVSFEGVRLAVAGSVHALVARAGSAQGLSSGPRASQWRVTYELEGAGVNVVRASLRLTPTSALAAAVLNASVSCTQPPLPITLSTTACSVWPDGSIAGDAFTGATSFTLRQSPYRVVALGSTRHRVALGSSATTAGSGGRGIQLAGTAWYGTKQLFTSTTTLLSSPSGATAELRLMEGLGELRPEPYYTLRLSNGRVEYVYADTGLVRCEGTFTGEVGLPALAPGEAGQPVTLAGVSFRTNAAGALSGIVSRGPRFAIGEALLLEPGDAGAQVYFPRWQEDHAPTHGKPNCADIYAMFGPSPNPDDPYNFGSRAGLTVTSGLLHAAFAQASFAGTPPPGRYTVRAPVYGAMTITPWGWAGDLSSGARSFVRADVDLATSEVQVTQRRATLPEIIAAGDTRPEIVRERFRLAALRVLNLRATHLRFCNGKLDRTASVLEYDVHFPFPSYVTLTFADSTLDDSGAFTRAAGPLGTYGLRASSPTQQDGQRKQPDRLLPNPETWILWAWRLPVHFAPLGTTVTFPGGTAAADVRVSADTSTVVTTVDLPGTVVTGIVGSEVEIPRLYSRHSALGAGVRFGAALSPDGGFTFESWDETPFLARSYVSSGRERDAGFDVTLQPLPLRSIALADPEAPPSRRAVDYHWRGQILLPFFGTTPVAFDVREQQPTLVQPLSLAATHLRAQCVGPTVQEVPALGGLSVQVGAIAFDNETSRFTSRQVAVADTGSDGRVQYAANWFEARSFTFALVRLARARATRDTVLRESSSPGDCGNGQKWLRTWLLAGWISSLFERDLVCYDVAAFAARGNCLSCEAPYLSGTIEVRTRDCPNCDERPVMQAVDSRYYATSSPPILELHNTDLSLRTDESEQAHITRINVPSAQLEFKDGEITGDFGATMAPVAASLPYEGEFRFYLDTRCGYFYVLGAGSFTYYLRFSGSMFVVHAPYGKFSGASPFPLVSGVIEDLAIRSLCADPAQFTRLTGLDQVPDPNTIVTGALHSGAVRFGLPLPPIDLGIEAGATLYAFAYTSGGSSRYCLGTFVNADATASAYVAEITGEASLSARVCTGSLTDFEAAMASSDLTAEGSLCVSGCVNAMLGHCQGGVHKCWVRYSSSSGLEAGGCKGYFDCGLGGCTPGCSE